MTQDLLIAHAGSLTALLRDDLAPGFEAETGCTVTRCAGPAVGLANRILAGDLAPDLYLTADVETNRLLFGPAGGDKVRWWLGFARTRMVLAYNPQSRFAGAFAAAARRERAWYDVLQEPGLVFRRSDPRVDPGGYRGLFVFQLAERHYGLPGLKAAILQGDENEAQILHGKPAALDPAVDAVLMYVTSARDYDLPFVELPPEIDLSSLGLADWYRTATYTNPQGQVFVGTPATYGITIPVAAANGEAAARFVAWLFGRAGQAALLRHGFAPTPAQPGGELAALPAALRPLLKR